MEAELATMLLEIRGKLGRIEGGLESLDKAFADERNLAREERRTTLIKLEEIDRLHNDLASMRGLFDQTRTQVYSNKSEIEALKTGSRNDVEAIRAKHAEDIEGIKAGHEKAISGLQKQFASLKNIQTKILGVAAAAFAVGGMASTGLYWVISSWHEVIPFLRDLPAGKP